MSIELPEHLRTGPLAEAAARALQDAASMAASSNSIPRISLRGREFRFIEDGEEIAKVRDSVDVIIVGVEPAAHSMIKTFYAAGYTSGAKEPPTCSSEDGIAPASWVQEKQHSNCQQCPKNAFGSAKSPSGKPTKACRDSKRIWLKAAPNKDIPGSDKPFNDRTLYGMSVTVASLKAFADHGRALAALGQGPAVAVTKMIMLDKEYPQLDFKIEAWLDAETAPLSLKMAAERPWNINFKNAGLALAMGESAMGNAPKATLPMAVPDHLKPKAVDVTDPRPTPSAADFDDAVNAW